MKKREEKGSDGKSSVMKNRRGIVMGYLLGVLQDKNAKPQRKDRIALKLIDYLYTKRSRVKPRVKGFNADGTPKGKKAQRRHAATNAGAKGGKWDGLLGNNNVQ